MMQPVRFAVAVVVTLAVAGLQPSRSHAQDIGYTVEQAQAGRLAYDRACASCHLENMAGAFEAPELAGPNFLLQWGGRPVQELFGYMRASMPPAGRKPSAEGFTSIIAYILQRNGLEPGGAALVATAATPVPTRAVVAGRVPTTAAPPAARAPDPPRPPAGPAAQQAHPRAAVARYGRKLPARYRRECC